MLLVLLLVLLLDLLRVLLLVSLLVLLLLRVLTVLPLRSETNEGERLSLAWLQWRDSSLPDLDDWDALLLYLLPLTLLADGDRSKCADELLLKTESYYLTRLLLKMLVAAKNRKFLLN